MGFGMGMGMGFGSEAVAVAMAMASLTSALPGLAVAECGLRVAGGCSCGAGRVRWMLSYVCVYLCMHACVERIMRQSIIRVAHVNTGPPPSI